MRTVPVNHSAGPRADGWEPTRLSCMMLLLEVDHHFDGLALVHRPVTIRHRVEADDPVKHAARLDTAFEHVGKELIDVRAHWSGAATDDHVLVESWQRRNALVVRHADAPDGAAGARDGDRIAHGLFGPHAF